MVRQKIGSPIAATSITPSSVPFGLDIKRRCYAAVTKATVCDGDCGGCEGDSCESCDSSCGGCDSSCASE